MEQKIIQVDEHYQTGYTYRLAETASKDFTPDFQPDLTPKQMLQMGIFGGDYFKERPSEFRTDWV